MKNLFTLIFVGFLLLTAPGSAQVVYVGGQTAQQLLQTFISPTSGTVSNPTITFTDPGQYGIFTDAAGVTGMNGGIVLSSGLCQDLSQTGSSTNLSDQLGGPGDDDVLAIGQLVNPSVTSSNDAVVFEFDFTPFNDTIKFNYVFGSDEYDTYVGTQFTDAFGFFISGGTEYLTPTNIAIIPGSVPPTPVAINTINSGSFNSFYIDNDPFDDGLTNGPYPISINGYTVLLEAMAVVTPCQTYRLKLAIADMVDESFNSYVFLKANSFSSSGTFLLSSVSNGTSNGDTLLYEGCENGLINVTRINNLSDTVIVPITVTGSATEGTDFGAVIDTLIFYPGDTTLQIPLNILTDAISENNESVTIGIADPTLLNCQGNPVTVSITFYISDITPMVLDITPDSIGSDGCNPVTLTANISGGTGNYSYAWSGGLPNQAVVSADPPTSTTYYLTVTDACPLIQPINDSAIVTLVVNNIVANLTASALTVTACDPVVLTASAQNGVIPYTYTWSNGLSPNTTNTVNPTQTTTYTVVVTDICNSVPDTVTITINVTPPPPVIATATASQTLVSGCAEVSLTASATGGTNNYTYFWDNNLGTSANVTTGIDETTTYTVIISDQCGAIADTASITVEYQPDTISVTTTPGDTTVYCGTPIFLQAFATSTGASDYFEYNWSTGDTVNIITVVPQTDTTFTVIVTDSCGSIAGVKTITISIECDIVSPDVFTPNGDGFNDFLVFANLLAYSNNSLVIYNRWGTKIYESADYKNNWDGENHTPGVYFYILEIPEKNQKLNGTITILK